MNPGHTVLIAERAGFAFPGIGGEILFELLIRHFVHPQPSHGDGDSFHVFRARPDADSTEHTVLAATEQAEHLASMILIDRLTENLAEAFGDRIAANNDSVVHAWSDVGCFLVGQPRHQFGRRFAAAHSTFGAVRGWDDLELIAGGSEQFAASRRLAGED